MENVAALLGRGLDVVLGDLAALGYDAEWHCIQPDAVGIPAHRDRIWICAYPSKEYVAEMVDAPRLSFKLRGMGGATVSRIGRNLDFSRMGRGIDGVPDCLDRFGALGNAVVPQIPEMLGRAYLESINA